MSAKHRAAGRRQVRLSVNPSLVSVPENYPRFTVRDVVELMSDGASRINLVQTMRGVEVILPERRAPGTEWDNVGRYMRHALNSARREREAS